MSLDKEQSLNDLTAYMEEQDQNITIEQITLRGLARRMQKVFDIKYTPLMIVSNDRWPLINDFFKLKLKRDRGVDLPIIVFKPGTFEVDSTGYNVKSLLRSGVYANGTADANSFVSKLEVIPVKYNMEVTCITDDYKFASKYFNRWLFASVTKKLNMNVNFCGFSFPTTVACDSTITVPQKDNSPEAINVYEIESTLIVNGYMSTDIPISELPQVPIITQINLRTIIGDEATDPALGELITFPEDQ